eukprot:6180079-Pleurochrysis_carterae.AAC.3
MQSTSLPCPMKCGAKAMLTILKRQLAAGTHRSFLQFQRHRSRSGSTPSARVATSFGNSTEAAHSLARLDGWLCAFARPCCATSEAKVSIERANGGVGGVARWEVCGAAARGSDARLASKGTTATLSTRSVSRTSNRCARRTRSARVLTAGSTALA